MLIDLNEILIEAAKKENMVILKAALGKGADINAKDNSGMSALMYAEKNNYTQMANYLREKMQKAEGNLVDNHNQSIVNDKSELKATNDFNKPFELVQITDAGGYIDYNKDSNKSNQHQKDVENNTNVIRLYPKYPKAYHDRGFAHYKLGEWQKAIDDFFQAGKLYVEQKEKAKAQACADWIKKIDRHSSLVTELQKIVNQI